MYISKIRIKNFRLLKDSILLLGEDKKQDLSLLIGRNNSGKTSFIMLFDKFYRGERFKFDYDDFSLGLRDKILKIDKDTDTNEFSIQLILEIKYSEDESLENISDFILDLDPEIKEVKILFDCSINKNRLLKDLSVIEKHKDRFIKKNLGIYLDTKFYIFDEEENLQTENRYKLIEKNRLDIKKLINFQVIHAKRNVSSSELPTGSKTALSELTTDYFNQDNKVASVELLAINESILKMDGELDAQYEKHFEGFLGNAKKFLGVGNIKVISNLESKQIFSNYSKIVYEIGSHNLPENLNGLGYLNILFLLLKIEVKKTYFESEKKSLNLLFIEEPEAHTHPQMQYVFAKKIQEIIGGIENLQTFISTHSSHIVSQCNFEDIRYFKLVDDNVKIKNFYAELKIKYAQEEEHFKFLKQYLSLYASELFFAEKIIFIEGISERMLLPYFIKEYDQSHIDKPIYIPITSQNISILEVGANAKVFSHFLEFLDIKTLVLTDIDTAVSTKVRDDSEKGEHNVYKASPVISSNYTSNATIKHYLKAPSFKDIGEFNMWFENLKLNKLEQIDNLRVFYQIEENGYHARSFEDAFISLNLDRIIANKNDLKGIKNKKELVPGITDYYALTKLILKEKGKSDFASSILFLALTDKTKWEIPLYIKEGLKWIAE